VALAELLAGLERDAEAEIAALRQSAQGEATALLAAAEEGAARRRATALAAERATLAAEEARAATSALLAARGEELSAGAALLARAAAAAEAACGERERELDAASLRRLLVEGRRFLPPGRTVFRCPAGLAAAAREAAAGSDIVVELAGGERAPVLAGGGWEVDLSLPSLLRRRWSDLAPKLLRVLEAPDGGPGSGR
jgi:vacuolar-type H+-ATPase subunit E/Vma4